MRSRLLMSGLCLLVAGVVVTTIALFTSGGQGVLAFDLAVKPTVMSTAYKAYGNREAAGGKYWLAKVVLKNTGDAPLGDLRMSFQVPGLIPWTTPEAFPELLPGQTLAVPFFPRFPASVAALTSMTPSSFELKLSYDDGSGVRERLEHRDFQLRGVQQFEYSSLPPSEVASFADAHDNAELSAAWVTEDDPVVRSFYARVSERAGGFGVMQNAKELEQFARSTYDMMLALGMTYSGTKGLPERQGDRYVLVQSMRLPRDVIYGNTGLCIELAQLWCSLAISSGAACDIMLIPGHAFPVLRAQDGSQIAVESTGIGGSFAGGNLGPAMTFEQAAQTANALFEKVVTGEVEGLQLDILTLRDQGIRPPELSDIDRTALIAELDKRLGRHGPPPAQPAVGATDGLLPAPPWLGPQPNTPPDLRPLQPLQPLPPAQPDMNGMVTWREVRGRFGFDYPGAWALDSRFTGQMQTVLPGFAASYLDTTNGFSVDGIALDGLTDPNAGIAAVTDAFRKGGVAYNLGGSDDLMIGSLPVRATELLDPSKPGTTAVLVVFGIPGGLGAVLVAGPTPANDPTVNILDTILATVRTTDLGGAP